MKALLSLLSSFRVLNSELPRGCCQSTQPRTSHPEVSTVDRGWYMHHSRIGGPRRSPEEPMGSTLPRREGCNRRSEVSLFSSSWQLKLNKSWASSPTLNGLQFSFSLLVLFPLCPHPHRKGAQVSGISRQIIIGSWSKGLKCFLHFCVSHTASEMELGGGVWEWSEVCSKPAEWGFLLQSSSLAPGFPKVNAGHWHFLLSFPNGGAG